jgi:oxygen-independent coproporphyrinogen-3 oxidase
MATHTERVPERWLTRVDQTGTGELAREPLSHREQSMEMLMMGLRLSEGVEEERLGRTGGGPAETLLDGRGVNRALRAGWLRRESGRLIATPSGRQRLDHLLRLLI